MKTFTPFATVGKGESFYGVGGHYGIDQCAKGGGGVFFSCFQFASQIEVRLSRHEKQVSLKSG